MTCTTFDSGVAYEFSTAHPTKASSGTESAFEPSAAVFCIGAVLARTLRVETKIRVVKLVSA